MFNYFFCMSDSHAVFFFYSQLVSDYFLAFNNYLAKTALAGHSINVQFEHTNLTAVMLKRPDSCSVDSDNLRQCLRALLLSNAATIAKNVQALFNDAPAVESTLQHTFAALSTKVVLCTRIKRYSALSLYLARMLAGLRKQKVQLNTRDYILSDDVRRRKLHHKRSKAFRKLYSKSYFSSRKHFVLLRNRVYFNYIRRSWWGFRAVTGDFTALRDCVRYDDIYTLSHYNWLNYWIYFSFDNAVFFNQYLLFMMQFAIIAATAGYIEAPSIILTPDICINQSSLFADLLYKNTKRAYRYKRFYYSRFFAATTPQRYL